jgi:hypothetical protein
MTAAIEGLREALTAEAAAERHLAALVHRVDTASLAAAAAHRHRKSALERLAAGDAGADPTSFDQAIAQAESTATVLVQAITLADQRAREASQAVASILRRILTCTLAHAESAHTEAIRIADAAQAERNSAFDRLSSARRALNVSDDILRGMFTAEITDASA